MKPQFYHPKTWKVFNEWLNRQSYSMIVILCDDHTHTDCVPMVLVELETDLPIELIEIESGELHKNLASCQSIWEALTEFHADRKTLIVNIGGGVITDMGAFVAATYLRGVDFVQFPTSLLAMVDASIGGKTGVDLGIYKNRIGTFSQAQKNIIIPQFLDTLEHSELVSGFAEMLKHGLIADAEYFTQMAEIAEINVSSVIPFIEHSVDIKYDIVEADPNEKGLRKILNFGHTIGHAIESYHLENQNPILHGFAVAIGMHYETELAYQINKLSEKDKQKIQKCIGNWYLIPTYNKAEVAHFVNLMKNDKKNESQQISFSLLDEIGKCSYGILVEEESIAKAMLA